MLLKACRAHTTQIYHFPSHFFFSQSVSFSLSLEIHICECSVYVRQTALCILNMQTYKEKGFFAGIETKFGIAIEIGLAWVWPSN